MIIEDWRIDYNTNRPHTAHGDLTPAEFAKPWTINHPKPHSNWTTQRVPLTTTSSDLEWRVAAAGWRVSAAYVTQYADLGTPVDVLGHHRRACPLSELIQIHHPRFQMARYYNTLMLAADWGDVGLAGVGVGATLLAIINHWLSSRAERRRNAQEAIVRKEAFDRDDRIRREQDGRDDRVRLRDDLIKVVSEFLSEVQTLRVHALKKAAHMPVGEPPGYERFYELEAQLELISGPNIRFAAGQLASTTRDFGDEQRMSSDESRGSILGDWYFAHMQLLESVRTELGLKNEEQATDESREV